MTVLGIESSCDETAAAVVGCDGQLLSNVVHSQVSIHRKFGGVVPEVASRQHLAYLEPVVRDALAQAKVSMVDIDGIAVTRGPGLMGCLLTGVSFAKALAWSTGVPLVGVNHLEGHLTAAFLTDTPPEYPFVALLVSGGNTALVQVTAFGAYKVLGSTRDDAAGEAFDKVGKLLGLGYPAGAEIDRLARDGRADAYAFPRAMMHRGGLEFSFSGLKTSVLTFVRKHGTPVGQDLSDVCASFQEAVVDVLVSKTLKSLDQTGCTTVLASGGVAANSRLQVRLGDAVQKRGGVFHRLPLNLCTDNAAMIAWAGRHRLMSGERAPERMTAASGLTLDAS